MVVHLEDDALADAAGVRSFRLGRFFPSGQRGWTVTVVGRDALRRDGGGE